MHPLHQRLLECFTAETITTTTNPLDDSSPATTSLLSILTSLPSLHPTPLNSLLTALPPTTYQRLHAALTAIITADGGVAAGTWAVLGGGGVGCRAVVEVVDAKVERLGTRSLLLSACYVLLLALPSPPVFLANEHLLRRILVLLQKWAQKKQELTLQHKAAKHTKQQSKGKRAAATDHMQLSEDDHDDDEANDAADDQPAEAEEDVELLMGEAGERAVVQLLKAFQQLLSQWSLLPMPDIKQTMFEALVAVTRTQAEDSDKNDSPSLLAWQLLGSLCRPLHGDPATTFSLLLKPLLPNCLMSLVLHTTPSPPRPLQLIHTATITFLVSTAPAPFHLLPFLQHVLVSMPDKADYRRVIQHSLVDVLAAEQHAALLVAYVPFLFKVSRNAKPTLRQAAVDVAALLLTSETALRGERAEAEEEEGGVTLGGLLELLLLRCSDRSPVVRTRALGALSELLQLAGERKEVRDALVTVLEEENEDEEMPDEPESFSGPARRTSLFLSTPYRHTNLSLSAMDLYTPVTTASLMHHPNTPSGTAPPSLGIQSLLRLLHRRATDPKALVRRAALLALHQLLLLHSTAPLLLPSLSAVDLQVLYDGCMDASVAVRKASCGALTSLVRVYAADEVMGAVWCGAVLPLVEDGEAGVAERAVQCVSEAVLERLEGADEVERVSVLRMLGAMDEATVRQFQLAVARLLKQNGVSRGLLAQLNDSIGGSQERGVWLLLEAVCQHQPDAIDVQRLCATWSDLSDLEGSFEDLCVRVLSCIAHTASRLPLPKLVHLATQLTSRVCDLQTPLSPQLVKLHIHTLAALTTAAQKRTTASQRCEVPRWSDELLVVCSHRLEQLVLGGQVAWSGAKEEAVVVRCLYSIGELVVRGTVIPSAGVVSCVQSLTANSVSASTQPTASSPVRAHAFICLGKLCLKDHPLAKRSLPLLIVTLTAAHSTPVAIRNNLLLVLADLCRTFTALVDPHLPALVGCLSDGCALLRRHALLVVCQLVQEDYVKLRAAVLMPLLAALADEDESVAAVARSSLTHLMQQHASKLQHSFLDAIFFFNGCVNTPAPASSTSSVTGGFSLSSYSRRSIVYDFLCSQLSDENKLLTASKLCQDVLSAVVDGSLPLNERTSLVVHDTLTVLASDNMKLHTANKPNAADDELADDDSPSSQQPAVAVQHVADSLKQAKSRLLSRLSKRSIVEQVLPVLMELKRRLEAARSPLVRAVLEWMRCLYVEWKSDVVAVLAADRQLAVEMEYDLKRLEEERKEKSKRHSAQRRVDSATSRSRRKPQARAEAAPAHRLSLSNVAASLPSPSPARATRPSLSSASPPSSKPSDSAAAPAPRGRTSLPGNAAAVSSSVPYATPAKAAGRSGAAPSPSSAVFQSPRLLRGHSTPASVATATTTAKRLSLRAMAAPVPLFNAEAGAGRASVSPLAEKKNTAAALTVNFSPSAVDGASAATWKLDKLTLSSAKKSRPSTAAPSMEEEAEDDEQPGSRGHEATKTTSLRKRRISASAEQQVKQETTSQPAADKASPVKLQIVKRSRSGRGRNITGD